MLSSYKASNITETDEKVSAKFKKKIIHNEFQDVFSGLKNNVSHMKHPKMCSIQTEAASEGRFRVTSKAADKSTTTS